MSWDLYGLHPVVVQQIYLTESVHKVLLQESISARICQLIRYVSDNEEYADGFVRELTFAKRLFKNFMRD